jgi:hypothetical protein
VGAILVEGPNRRTHFWKTKMATKLKIEKGEMKLKKIFSSETIEPISTKLC